MRNITEEIQGFSDEVYAAFLAKLIPNVSKDRILGVRTPLLKAYAKEIEGTDMAEKFLNVCPHRYLEENNLHAFLLMRIRDFDDCLLHVENFLPFVDNWATCDSLRPPCFKRRLEKLHIRAVRWIEAEHVYTKRFGIGMLLSYFMGDAFSELDLETVAAVRSEEYYVRMMVAWYFATALAMQYDSALPYIENRLLDGWTHRKTIQKAVESYRITENQKALLRSLK